MLYVRAAVLLRKYSAFRYLRLIIITEQLVQIGTVARYSEMCFAQCDREKKKEPKTGKSICMALIAASRSSLCLSRKKTFSTSISFLATSYSRSYFSPSRRLILLWYWFRMDFTLAVKIQVTSWKNVLVQMPFKRLLNVHYVSRINPFTSHIIDVVYIVTCYNSLMS